MHHRASMVSTCEALTSAAAASRQPLLAVAVVDALLVGWVGVGVGVEVGVRAGVRVEVGVRVGVGVRINIRQHVQ